MARARCPRSSVEAGQKCVKIKQHSSHFRKIGACLHQILNLRNEILLSTPAPMEKCRRMKRQRCVSKNWMFLIVKVFENTPAVLSLGKVRDEKGYSFEWINGQKPHLIKSGIRIK